MNSTLFKRLSTITILMFLGLIIWLFIYVYKLEDNLVAYGVVDLIGANTIRPLINNSLFLTGATMATGLLSIIFLLAAERYKSTQEQIIVENFSQGQGTQTKKEETEESTENQALQKSLQKILTNIDKAQELTKPENIQQLLSEVCNTVNAAQGLLYKANYEGEQRSIELFAAYAFTLPDSETLTYEFGEGIAGQVAKEGQTIKIDQVPKGYITVRSGLGESSPNSVAVFPMKSEDEMVIGVAEIATFQSLPEPQVHTLEQIFNKIGDRLSSDSK